MHILAHPGPELECIPKNGKVGVIISRCKTPTPISGTDAHIIHRILGAPGLPCLPARR
jgi:hypothetical protein